MGAMTRGTLISEALEIAGDTSLTPRAQAAFNAALLRIYASAPWPFLRRRLGPTTVNAGTRTVNVGTGAVIFPVRIHSVEKAWLGDPRGRSEPYPLEVYNSDGLDGAEPLLTPNMGRGRPQSLICTQTESSAWAWSLEFEKPVDQAYPMLLLAHVIPNDLTDNTQTPIYPNDLTLLQAIKLYALEHQSDERWMVENGKLESFIENDRAIYLKLSQTNSKVPLSNRFKPYSRR